MAALLISKPASGMFETRKRRNPESEHKTDHKTMQIICALILLPVVIAVDFLRGSSGANGIATNSSLGCSYVSTCTAGNVEGVCVSISGGCCPGGTTTSGLCSGSNDIMCCTDPTCSTPYGTGVCEPTSSCSGDSFSGYCSGPSTVQ